MHIENATKLNHREIITNMENKIFFGRYFT